MRPIVPKVRRAIMLIRSTLLSLLSEKQLHSCTFLSFAKKSMSLQQKKYFNASYRQLHSDDTYPRYIILSPSVPLFFATLLVVTISSSRSSTVQQPSRQLLFLSLFPPLLPPICLESAAGPPPPPPHLIISISNSSGNHHHHCMIEASPSFLLLVTRDTWAPSHSGPTSNTDPNNRSRHPNRSRSRPPTQPTTPNREEQGGATTTTTCILKGNIGRTCI